MLIELIGFAAMGMIAKKAVDGVKTIKDNSDELKDILSEAKDELKDIGLKEIGKELISAGANSVKNSIEGNIVASASESLFKQLDQMIEDKGDYDGTTDIINYVCNHIRHEGSDESPYNEFDNFLLSTAVSVFESRSIYNGKTRLFDEMKCTGHNVEELEQFL